MVLLAMVKKSRVRAKASRAPLLELQSGQIWELAGSNLQIGLLGKTLVHYKHYKKQNKGHGQRGSAFLASKKVLESYLKENNAILVEE
jgi:hypothetical protein